LEWRRSKVTELWSRALSYGEIVRELQVSRVSISSDAQYLMTNNLLTTKEAQHKDEIIDLTEEVLHARGLECDDRISKLSEEKLKEILEEVRKPRRRRRTTYHNVSDNDSREKEDLLYIK
jgi:orotate phosphoribosyltransferase-like protein